MKVQIYSHWCEDVFVPARVKQFSKAARLMGCTGFQEYAQQHDLKEAEVLDERELVGRWLAKNTGEVPVKAEGVA
ncbi:hypothetical protein [Mitsuokella jalaludinii]|uniref:hypothetical protein n=1 Tax=Mitsuokella jalaludinii TaxID=187979 RepID=UPI003F9B634B